MPRVTIKDLQKQLEELKQSINERDIIIQKLNNEISEMIDKSDTSFENSATYKQMAKKMDYLELKIKSINDSAEHNRHMYDYELKRNSELISEIQKLKNENIELTTRVDKYNRHNERNAGRKSRFTDKQVSEIKSYRADGKTIKQIADMFNCSVGLIHKLINE